MFSITLSLPYSMRPPGTLAPAAHISFTALWFSDCSSWYVLVIFVVNGRDCVIVDRLGEFCVSFCVCFLHLAVVIDDKEFGHDDGVLFSVHCPCFIDSVD